MQADCVFCKIAAGQLPSCRVYEDKVVLAFLDIAPLIKGHTLVIPKAHYDPLMDTPPDILTAMFLAAQRLARAMITGLGADGVNLHQANGGAAGQVVPHVHVHVVPRFQQDGHSWNWRPKAYANPAEAQALAARLKEAVEPAPRA